MFRGEDGPLKSDVQELIDWLQAEVRPDIVHLSNVMLAGLARPLRRAPGSAGRRHAVGRRQFPGKASRARTTPRPGPSCGPGPPTWPGLVAMCEYYADFMAEYLTVPREKIDVIRPGLNLDGYW